jgi:hypothetical protein
MDAMVEMEDTVGSGEEEEQKIALWLSQTADSQEAAVRTATQHLEAAQQTMPKFASLLLRLSAGGQEKGQRIASATYLKNFLRSHWTEGKLLSPQERLEFRNQLVEVLLRVDGLVLKLLAEAFRLVAVHDFAKQKSWSELVPALKTAIHNSDLVTVPAPSEFKTLNVLIALQTIIKPFQYFVDPTVAREPAPEQLELISKELLAPLQAIFHHLVQEGYEVMCRWHHRKIRDLHNMTTFCLFFASASILP